MFKSKVRPINIPHYEHSRLAGIFASFWGNQDFERPVIDNIAFVQGVALHDWHYSPIDNLPLGEASEDEWLEVVCKGVEQSYSNPTTDIVAKLHIKRLLSNAQSLEAENLAELIEVRITERLPQTNITREQFEWADKITAFCDFLSFDYCFEEPVQKTRSVYSNINEKKEKPITYWIKPGGEIMVEPWPFNISSLSGMIFGYERSGYPERLQPIVLPYHCLPGTSM